jgi:hypothetical protein
MKYPPVGLLVVLMLGACGGEAALPASRGLTTEEASRLAEIRFDNYGARGADFSATAAFIALGESLTLTGSVDWQTHSGTATVSASGRDAGVERIVWFSDAVLEVRPGLLTILASTGQTGVEYVRRTPEVGSRLLDRTIALIVALASPERENALLIQQTEGSAFLRFDTIRGRDVEVLRFGKSLRYWLDVETGELLRFEADSPESNAPVVVDLLAFGLRKVPNPSASTVVDSSTIQDLYDAAMAP